MQIQWSCPVVWCLIAVGAVHPTLSVADDVWKVIPQEAQAFSVVRDMDSFSNKIDHIARTMSFPEPQALEFAMSQSGIRQGLDVNGNLACFIRPQSVEKGGVPLEAGTVYLLPASDFERLIKPLVSKPVKTQKKAVPAKVKPVAEILKAVRIIQQPGFAAELGSSAAFALANDQKALLESLDFGPNVRTEIAALEGWLTEQDAYCVVNRSGIDNGLKGIDLPLSKGNFILDLAFAGVSELATSTFAKSLKVRQLAVGIRITPEEGAAFSSCFVASPDTDLGLFFPQEACHRDETLNRLPDAPLAFAAGGPVSPQRARQITLDLKRELHAIIEKQNFAAESATKTSWRTLIERIEIDVSRVQIGVFPPEPAVEKVGPVPITEPDQLAADLLRSVVLVLEVEHSRAAMADLADWFGAFPASPEEIPGLGPVCTISPLKSGTAEGIPVLRAIPPDELPQNLARPVPRLMIAAPDRRTIVVIAGTEADLQRALQPFREGGTNLAQATRVSSAVKMLPESSAWVAVVDGRRSLNLALRTLYQTDQSVSMVAPFVSLIPDTPPLAVGTSWRAPMLDVTLAAPNELLAAIGQLAAHFVHVPKAAGKGKK